MNALGNETVIGLQGSVPIDIDPRVLTPHFEGLEGLKAGEDVRAKIAASLEGKLETDACTAQLEFVHDANGAPGTAMAEGETFPSRNVLGAREQSSGRRDELHARQRRSRKLYRSGLGQCRRHRQRHGFQRRQR